MERDASRQNRPLESPPPGGAAARSPQASGDPDGFEETLARSGVAPLRRGAVETLQVNVGRLCDLACHHCHVEAGPARTEILQAATAERVLALLRANPGIRTLDLTGGAPELNPSFRTLVDGAHALGRRVIDRCNLTVLLRPGQEGTAAFLAAHRVHVIASLPCHSAENVDRQRGRDVFDRSIEALNRLNRLGYGRDPELRLDLVFNPQGPTLPPPQAELEAEYRDALKVRFDIDFHHLLTITNMPIRRFAHSLERDGRLEAYLELLVEHFNAETVPELMCRTLLSVSHDGRLYDCDFNQMLALPLGAGPRRLDEIEDLGALAEAPIATGRHCHGCTAGAGSSCGGALGKPDATP